MADQEISTRKPIVRILILAAGWILILLGVVGLFLPFLQGILLLLAGLSLLSLESKRARGFRDRLRAKHPGPDRFLRKVTGKVRGFFHRER